MGLPAASIAAASLATQAANVNVSCHLQAAQLVHERSIAAGGAPSELRISTSAEYAQLRLQREYTSPQQLAGACLPPAANVLDDHSLGRLAPGSTALRTLSNRLRQLEGQLFGGAVPSLSSPEFAAAVAELAQAELARLQASLMRSAQQV